MEITSFVLGMLTVTGLAIALLVVLGVVKIYKQGKQIAELESSLEKEVENIYRAVFEGERALNTRLDDTDRRIDHLHEETHRSITSYVDSRIDKLQTKKEVLKG